MLEVGKDNEIVADKAPQLIGLLMRTLEEFFEQPELVHHLERRGMDGVAAEVAHEIGMLLENQDVDAGAGEEEAEHHPGWSTAGERATRGDGLASQLVHLGIQKMSAGPAPAWRRVSKSTDCSLVCVTVPAPFTT